MKGNTSLDCGPFGVWGSGSGSRDCCCVCGEGLTYSMLFGLRVQGLRFRVLPPLCNSWVIFIIYLYT